MDRVSACKREEVSRAVHAEIPVREADRRGYHPTPQQAADQVVSVIRLPPMNDNDRARAERAQARAGTIHPRLMPQHPGREHDFSPVSGAAAIALAVELSRTAWTLAGRSLPDYRREDIPIRLSRVTPA